MNILLHDLDGETLSALNFAPNSNTIVISDNGRIKNCIGCFGCWIKTPGICVLKDGYETMGELLSKCEELTIVSQCVYGSYSPFVRNIFDRSLPYLLPYFVKRNGETHHKSRYHNKLQLHVYFYGENITDQEKRTSEALVKANAVNFYADHVSVHFCQHPRDIKEVCA